MRGLAEAFVARLAFERLLARVDTLVAGQLGQVTEALGAHGTLVGLVGLRRLKRRLAGRPDGSAATG